MLFDLIASLWYLIWTYLCIYEHVENLMVFDFIVNSIVTYLLLNLL